LAPSAISLSAFSLAALVLSGAISGLSTPAPTVSLLVFATISGIHFYESPTMTATAIAMHL
jgi:hypothetical protein